MTIEYIYNTSTNATSLVGFLQAVQSNVPFAEFILLAFYVVPFVFFLGFGAKKSFAGSAFLGWIVALTFYAMELLNIMYLTVSMIILGLAVVFLFVGNE
jgi:hypothetical protein